jgi:hypothetical protein
LDWADKNDLACLHGINASGLTSRRCCKDKDKSVSDKSSSSSGSRLELAGEIWLVSLVLTLTLPVALRVDVRLSEYLGPNKSSRSTGKCSKLLAWLIGVIGGVKMKAVSRGGRSLGLSVIGS